MFRNSICLILFVLAIVTTSGQAEITPISNIIITRVDNPGAAPNFWLESITIGGYTVTADELVTGVSEGVATAQPAPYDDITDADNFDLNLFAGRADEVPPTWQIKELGGKSAWTDTNRDNPDFFLFETGGNQDFSIEAILPGGVIGQSVNVPQSTFGDTGLDITTSGPHDGQSISGVAFAITDLLDQNGNNLTNSSVIEGIQISSPGLDPSGFYASVGGPVVAASNPDPADGALYAGTWASLSWRPGDFAVSHDVYLGDNFDDVNDGTAETFRGNQPLTPTTFMVGFFGHPYPDGLVPGTTYYWRIDEVNDTDPNSPWKGDVWSFMLPLRIAYDPTPADGARYVDPNVELNWTAGLDAELHYVYFGDNFDDVNSAVEGLLLADTTYTPGTLEVDKTYYWRVDESDFTTTQKGDVWSFSTIPDIPITDPNLLCWWKFDEGSGTTAVDYSGHNNHGTLMDDPQWVDGYDGGALEFGGDGDHVVDEDAENYLNGLNALTVGMWIKSDVTGTDKGFLEGEDPDGNDNVFTMRYDSDGSSFGGTNLLKMAVTSTGDEQQLESSSNLQVTEWQHVAMTWSSGDLIRFYVNGVEDTPSGRNNPNNSGPQSGVVKLIIGQGGKDSGGGWDGLIDDVRIYNKVLTADDIKQAMRGDLSRAWGPSPANGSTPDIEHATPLSWSPGDKVSQHEVYFGTDRDAVNNADTSDTTGVYRGQQIGTSYTPPEGVEWGGGPYYWRVDENNTDGTVTKGGTWSFTVADYILVDDFESYNDLDPGEPKSNRIFNTWIDGWEIQTNGSIIGYAESPFTEQTNVHGGDQSAPVFYDKFSEVELPISPAQDWTKNGVTVLSLYFHGDPSNTVSQMYVKVNNTKVVYSGNAFDIVQPWWKAWIIPLEEFTNQGANLRNVTKLVIGFGDEANISAGGSGMVLFDDIRLLRTAPEPPVEIWLEAEAADTIGASWRIYDDPASSGGRHIGSGVGDGDDNDTAPGTEWVAVYNFDAAGGVYKILLRAQEFGNDSFWVRIPGATGQTHEDPDQPGTGWVRFNEIDAPDGWDWDEVHSNDHGNAVVNWTLPAGPHTLEIAKREEGVLLDAIVITDDVD